MERLTNADRACAVAAAAARDLNDEFTIIVNCVSESIPTLEPGHPARLYLADIERATRRCAWKVSGLLNFTARHGVILDQCASSASNPPATKPRPPSSKTANPSCPPWSPRR